MTTTWFKSLSTPWKITVAVCVIAFIGYQAMSIRYRYIQYKWTESIYENREFYKDEKSKNKKKSDSVISKGEQVNRRAVHKNKAIDKKLENDKNNIDNSDYPDAKLDSLLSRY